MSPVPTGSEPVPFTANPPHDEIKHLLSGKPLRRPNRRGRLPDPSHFWVDSEGRVFDEAGERVVPGLTPQEVIAALSADEAGAKPLADIIAARGERPDEPRTRRE